MIGYRARLASDVKRWQRAGWLTEEGQRAIESELANSRSSIGLAGVLGVLGAVLIGFAAMSFVAANWQAMSKLARLAVIFGGLWASYGLAAGLYWKQLNRMAEGAVLAGIAIFGAGIMLISQIYHISGNPPDALFVWGLGALGATILLRSVAAGGAAIVLLSMWNIWQSVLSDQVHWQFLPVWAVASAIFYWLKWRPGFHLAMIALSIWGLLTRSVVDNSGAFAQVAFVGIAVAFAAAAGRHLIERYAPISKALAGYGILNGFAGLYGMQFIERNVATMHIVSLAVITLAVLVMAIFWGWLADNRAVLWLGYGAFSLEVLSLYFKTLGTLLGTSLFFLLAGLLVIALSWTAFQLHKRQLAGKEAAS